MCVCLLNLLFFAKKYVHYWHFVVNFWYDMAYDIRYCYYKFVESLISARIQLPPSSSTTRSASAAASESVTCRCGRSCSKCDTDTVDFAPR